MLVSQRSRDYSAGTSSRLARRLTVAQIDRMHVLTFDACVCWVLEFKQGARYRSSGLED